MTKTQQFRIDDQHNLIEFNKIVMSYEAKLSDEKIREIEQKY